LKPRYLIPSLAIVIALVAIVPAFGRDSSSDPASPGPNLAVPSAAPISKSDRAAGGTVDVPVHVTGPAVVSVEGEVPVGTETEEITSTGPDGQTIHAQAPANYAQAFTPLSVTATHAGTVVLHLHPTAAGEAILDRGEKTELVVEANAPGPGPTAMQLVPVNG
jgi:hypothetical protein